MKNSFVVGDSRSLVASPAVRRKPRGQSSLASAANAVVELLEDRKLFAGDASIIQTLPYSLDFDTSSGGVVDKNGLGTGFTWVMPNKNNNEYAPSLIDMVGGRLRVTTTGTSLAGGPWENDNTLVNGLQTQFSAASGSFSISTRLIGPLGYLNNASEQGGLLFGPDHDNYVKLVAVAQPNGTFLQFVDEQKPSTAFVHQIASANSYTNIGSFTAINTLDLTIAGDASTGQITAYYRINGGSLVQVNQTVTLTGAQKTKFFASNARGGIIAMQKNDLAAETLVFEKFEIVPGTPQIAKPSVRADEVTPAPSQTNVKRDSFVSAALNLPNVGKGVDTSTLNTTTVKLYRSSDRVAVSGHVSTSGAGDTITYQPYGPLDANTQYTFEVTAGVKDTGGATFVPFSMNFTTGTEITPTDTNIAFQKVELTTATGQQYSSVQIGPDGKLYASSLSGLIQRFTINSDGTLGAAENITTVQTANGGNRFITGIVFDPSSTANNLILWVNNAQYAFEGASDWTGKLSRLSGANLENYQDYITGLPRAVRDHLNNQMTFGPDGKMYFAMGSMSAMGQADNAWGLRAEHLLSAAVLQIDTAAIATRISSGLGALSVRTEGATTNYDPWATNAPVKIYATGVRNAYDLVWTRGGVLYAPTNGSAAGGATPASPAGGFTGTRIDQAQNGPYTGPTVPGIAQVNVSEPDFLFKIEQGGYYGHPNSTRGEYVLNGGNPTDLVDYLETSQYPTGTQPDRNYRGAAWIFGKNHSPNGVIEYQGNAFGGRLDGKLLVVRYSGGADVVALTLDANGAVTESTSGISGLSGFVNPLDLTQDLSNGNLYIVDYGAQKIVLAKPVAPGARITVDTTTLRFNDDFANSNTTPSATRYVKITNTGTAPLSIPNTGLTLNNTANWTITVKPGLPTTVAPGESVDVGIAFKATVGAGAGIKTATLTITSNDATNPSIVVNLRGLATTGTGGMNEPSLQRVLDLYQIPVVTGDANPADTNLLSNTAPLTTPNDEVVAQRFVKAGAGPITIEPLAAFAGGTPAVKFGYYQAGTAGNRTELVSISAADAQSVNPTLNGTTSFDPGASRFGLYAYFPIFSNYAYSEDSLNTKENTVALRRKFRFYPLKNADGSAVPNAYIFTNEDYNNDPSGGTDSNDFVGIIRNVSISNDGAEIGLENTDAVPFPDRLVFSRVQTQPPDTKTLTDGTVVQPPNNVTHDTAVLRLRNTGSAPLTLNSLAVSNTSAWTIVNAPTAGTQIAAGGFLDITVRFVAQTLPTWPGFNSTVDPTAQAANQSGFYTGSLTINTNDADEAVTTVQLAGWWQNKSEKNQEPSVPTLVNNILGYRTKILNNGQTMADGWNGAGVLGEEVLSKYWVRADGSAPVEVTQLAAWHGQGDTARLRWAPFAYPGSVATVFTHSGPSGQSILPLINGGTTVASGTFKPVAAAANPLSAFQFRVENEWSDDAMNSVPDNPLDTGHHIRFWPARDKNNNLIPNTWIMGMDYFGINYDYQDNLYLVSNMKPMPPGAPSGLAATGQPNGIALDWGDVTGAPLLAGYNVYRSTTTGGTYTKLNASPVTDSLYIDTSAASGVTYYYRVTAIDSWGGESGTSATVNAVRTTDNVPPAPPTGLAGTGVATGVTLNWSANNDADLAGYRVYRAIIVGGTYSLLNTSALVTLTSFTDSTATPGSTVYYTVSAVDFSGNESAQSTSATVVAGDTTAPAVPSGVAANTAANGLTVSWSAVADTDAAGYRVYRASAIDGTYTQMSGALVTGTTWTDTSVLVGETWFYKVSAVDTSGNESAQSAAASATRNAVALPTIRINTGGGAFTDSNGVTWAADQYFTGGTAAVSSHDVTGTIDDPLYLARRWGAYTYAVPAANGDYVLSLHFSDPVYTTAGSRKFSVKAEGLTILDNFDLVANAGGGKKKFVRSFNVTIADGFLNLQTIKILDNPIISAIELVPNAPDTTPPAAPGNAVATGAVSGNSLSWTAPADADLAGYNVYRSDSVDGTFVKLNTTLLTALSYLDTTATADVTSYYRVTAIDTALNESLPATASALRPAGDTVAPAVPANLSATAGTTSGINLAWTSVSDSDLAGYHVYRAPAPGGPWTKLTTAAITATTYADTVAPENTVSYYYVTAIDVNGNESSASATASATAPIFANGTGLYGKYYAGTSFNTLKLGRMDGVINFDWGAGTPNPAVPVDNFSARWLGKIKAAVTGNYTFTVRASDGVRLWVNGQLIIDAWSAGDTADKISSTIALVAGQKYDIRLEYFEGTGAANIRMLWEADGLSQQIVQRGYLFSA
ncbi:PA14 domain-containing protein [Humisphaera borealis]|uniref:Ig-like domain-containing protein n=1 Tax=Humisphaera borealis TaxID=2807512 RepID=A0A7M2X1L0_9BACT|nr:PA14 domain-containing protein [Humisphaera borealis]QOV91332.1 Ig-like domain-containing protein [Humisphaera borealis]